MSFVDVIILAAVAAGLFLAVRSMVRQRRRGGCPGCPGCSGSCANCADCAEFKKK